MPLHCDHKVRGPAVLRWAREGTVWWCTWEDNGPEHRLDPEANMYFLEALDDGEVALACCVVVLQHVPITRLNILSSSCSRSELLAL